jgi:hypothetical protein
MVMDLPAGFVVYEHSGCHLHSQGVNEIQTNSRVHKKCFKSLKAGSSSSSKVVFAIPFMRFKSDHSSSCHLRVKTLLKCP